MRKPVTSSLFGKGTVNRFGRSSLGGGPSVSNSNTRIAMPGTAQRSGSIHANASAALPTSNLGLNSDRLREQMVQRLREQNITDDRVLAAIKAVPRHLFVDEGLASRAYEDAALPIGYGQTISQPWIVARMISVACEPHLPTRVLEVGAGCGYQAAVLAQLAGEVYSIERIKGLYDQARIRLASLKSGVRVRLSFGDGMLGLPAHAPYDAILVAAAGMKIPQALLDQLAVGGRLVAPEGGADQRLILVERTGSNTFNRIDLESVRFVPLRAGTQL